MPFSLGGQPSILPGPIIKGLLKSQRRTSWWSTKVNSFRHIRGVYPSKGYLLMTRGAVDSVVKDPSIKVTPSTPKGVDVHPLQLTIVPEKRNKKNEITQTGIIIPNIIIKKATAVNPGKSVSSTMACIVELTDTRVYLSQTMLYEDFNLVDEHTNNSLTYTYSSMKPASSSRNPYTWKELIDYLWNKPSESVGTLNHDDTLYPATNDVKPTNYHGQGVTAADLLDQVLNDLGLTIIPQSDGTYSVIELDANADKYNQFMEKGGFDNALQEIRHQVNSNVIDIPGKITYEFPARNYLDDPEHDDAQSRYQKYPFYKSTKTITSSPYSWATVNEDLEIHIKVNPVAFFGVADTANTPNPSNKQQLDNFIELTNKRYTRRIANIYGPMKSIGGLQPVVNNITIQGYPKFNLLYATTWFWNASESGSMGVPQTLIEIPEPKIKMGEYFLPEDNFPYHRSIIIKPKAKINEDEVGDATVVDYYKSGSAIQSKNSGEAKVINLSGSALSSSKKYTADYHWQTQSWAVWPGSNNSDSGGTGTGTGASLIRFRLAEDLEKGEVYAEAVIVDSANTPVDKDGNPITDESSITNWVGNQQVQVGDIRRATVANSIDQSWEINDYIKSTTARTTNPVFNTEEMQFWFKVELQTASIIVVDYDNKFYGYGPYTDPRYDYQEGYYGSAYLLPVDDGGEDFAGTGLPGYYIVDMQGPARWIEGIVVEVAEEGESVVYPSWQANTEVPPLHKVKVPVQAGGFLVGEIIISTNPSYRTTRPTFDSAEAQHWKKFADAPQDDPLDYFYVSLDKYWGDEPNGRLPKNESKTATIDGYPSNNTFYVIKVYVRLGETIPKEGTKVRCVLDDDQQIYVIQKGDIGSMLITTSTQDVVGASVFTASFDDIIMMFGTSPTEDFTVKNDMFSFEISNGGHVCCVQSIADGHWYCVQAECPN